MYHIKPIADKQWSDLVSLWGASLSLADQRPHAAHVCAQVIDQWLSEDPPSPNAPEPTVLRAMRANHVLESIIHRAVNEGDPRIIDGAWDLALSGILHPDPQSSTAHEWIDSIVLGIDEGLLAVPRAAFFDRLFSPNVGPVPRRALANSVEHHARHSTSFNASFAEEAIVHACSHVLTPQAVDNQEHMVWIDAIERVLFRLMTPGEDPARAQPLVDVVDAFVALNASAPLLSGLWNKCLKNMVQRALSEGETPEHIQKCRDAVAHVCVSDIRQGVGVDRGFFTQSVLVAAMSRRMESVAGEESWCIPLPGSLDCVAQLWHHTQPSPSALMSVLDATQAVRHKAFSDPEVSRIRADLWTQLGQSIMEKSMHAALASKNNQRAEELCALLPEERVAAIYETHINNIASETPNIRAAWEKSIIRRAVSENDAAQSAPPKPRSKM